MDRASPAPHVFGRDVLPKLIYLLAALGWPNAWLAERLAGRNAGD